jgi:hypothetical protein
MLGSHHPSRYLASSPIAFQLFQNLKSGQVRHHNALEKLRSVPQKAADRSFSTFWAASIAVQRISIQKFFSKYRKTIFILQWLFEA